MLVLKAIIFDLDLHKQMVMMIIITMWALLKISSDIHAQTWCELVATVHTPISCAIFTPAITGTIYKRL